MFRLWLDPYILLLLTTVAVDRCCLHAVWPVQVLTPNGESPSAPNRRRACVSHVGEHDEGPLVKTRS